MEYLSTDLRGQLVDRLQRQIQALEQSSRSRPATISTSGCVAVDRLLPCGGLRRGTLVEWLADGAGTGAGTLALLAARAACEAGGAMVIVDDARDRYMPAVARWGVDLERVIVVRPERKADAHWSVDQALRCPAVAAVWGRFERLDGRTFRRWQLAAEESDCLGLLLRPVSVRGQPSWADIQFLVEPQPSHSGRRMRVEIVRCRGGAGGGQVVLELDETTGVPPEVSTDDETLSLHRAAEEKSAARKRRATGA